MELYSRRTFGLATGAAATCLAGGAAGMDQAGRLGMAIDEGLFVNVNGQEQWITIRGRDLANPVLLLLHGGPGFPTSFMAPIFAEWEKRFTVVQWDQPGGGATYSKNLGRHGPMTYARFVDDGIAVTEWICERLKTKKVVLLGNSWGTSLGVMMIQKRPELFAAYVGTSQVVSGPQGDRVGYEMGLQAARDRGDAAAVTALEKVGPPPYATLTQFLVRQTYTNPPGAPPSAAEAAASMAFGKVMMTPPPADARYIARGLPPYDGGKVFMETQAAVFSQARVWEVDDYGAQFKVPIFVFQGDQDLNTPFALARDWIARIRAPRKGFVAIEGAGHNTLVFHDRILALLERHVRPLVISRKDFAE